ncbi:hypothetical protein H2199_000530 [Coniosporium tulheliwenetii]|uniref:Uncharacterized protein n=1 Tax=Coniosporium tulheliwenetii TaxID=3383036 RepID=A0ACC2ZQ88_9PEZI|nr:hypothetical protein H2199_000530 [Cladosporium sp. JES 115]
MVARTPKSRPAVSNLFAKPNSRPAAVVQDTSKDEASTGDSSPETAKKIASSSAALREQIAKARAAARKTAPKKQNDIIDSCTANEAEFDLSSDPFNVVPKTSSGLLRRRVEAARVDGRLNIAAMGLKEISKEVLNMYDYDPNDPSKTTWSEMVDLTRFIAAENELENITDVFPDIDPELASMADDDDDAKKPQFGGVEVLDLHGNLLREVPLGLRRLQYLTSLNLSRNRLGVDALNTIAQVESLKELKLADNSLEGQLPNAICRLKRLEVLEVQGNRLSSLPDSLLELINLRILNLSDNSLSALPVNALSSLPLIELLAAKNRLNGALFNESCTLHRLQLLDVSNNALDSLSGNEPLSLPTLRTLNINTNRIKSLPNLSTWTSLISLLAQDNKLSDLPNGFTTLPSLRNVDFTGNDFTKLNERLALMKSLEVFTIAANPLRERKFLTMSTDNLKQDLAARLAPSDRDRITEGHKAEEIGEGF